LSRSGRANSKSYEGRFVIHICHCREDETLFVYWREWILESNTTWGKNFQLIIFSSFGNEKSFSSSFMIFLVFAIAPGWKAEECY